MITGVVALVTGLLLVAAVACGETTPQPTATQTSGVTEPTAHPTSEAEKVEVPFDINPCRMTRAAQLPIEFEYEGTTPTEFDGINKATCTFTKSISKVSVTLRNGGGSVHGETFFIDPPSDELSFPLPDGLLSEMTLEQLRPGEYEREMMVTSVDGDTLLISDQPGVLRTVTILGP